MAKDIIARGIAAQALKKAEEGGGGVTLDDIVDSHGNKRFIEGNGTPENIFEDTYCKWSLSGTHLMVVLAGKLPISTSYPVGTLMATYTLPEWVANKIVPVVTSSGLIDEKQVFYKTSGGGTNYKNAIFLKSGNTVQIKNNAGGIIGDDFTFRVQFDLLIDSE